MFFGLAVGEPWRGALDIVDVDVRRLRPITRHAASRATNRSFCISVWPRSSRSCRVRALKSIRNAGPRTRETSLVVKDRGRGASLGQTIRNTSTVPCSSSPARTDP